MTTISIPKENALELIKNDTCRFYDYNSYLAVEINVVFYSTTKLKEFESALKLSLTFRDLSSLLFDKVVKVSDALTIIVV